MTIIQATSGTYRSRVDGTVVLSVEIEPRHAQEALALFGMPGTSLAIARLVSEHEKPIQEKKKVGDLCIVACNYCKDKRFWHWLNSLDGGGGKIESEKGAAECIYACLGISSRKEIDDGGEIAESFHETFRKPFMAWLEENG
jgi:hypothetical protein